MGKHFGELAFIRGIIYYKLSPYEQKPFVKVLPGILNFVTRSRPTFLTWFPPFLFTYITYQWVEATYRCNKRKNPLDYRHEVDPDAVDEE